MKQIIVTIIDLVLWPLVLISGFLLKGVRRIGVQKLPLSKRALLQVGVFPLRNHYYEPQFDFRSQPDMIFRRRPLPGIKWNIEEQLALLQRMTFSDELREITKNTYGGRSFSFENSMFQAGDAEYWYQIVRVVKPKKIIEIGSGFSTLVALNALSKNREEDSKYECKHLCIEPFEVPWLEGTDVSVIREPVEKVDLSVFEDLEAGDILFIDSSHIIRPEGDVLFEYLELMPRLADGVVVHIHDIFSPRNYPDKWVKDDVRFWNEQYLLEAFLTDNACWKIIGSINLLYHEHYDALKAVCPFLDHPKQPASFYIVKSNKSLTDLLDMS